MVRERLVTAYVRTWLVSRIVLHGYRDAGNAAKEQE